MDLYDDLGVGRDATPDEIKAAHRDGVKKHHPDRPDGDKEKFLAVQRAFDVLGDEIKRRQYDETGDPDGDSAMAKDAKLRELLHHLVGGLIDGDLDLDKMNIVDHVRKHLSAVELQIRDKIKTAERRVARVDKMVKRLRKKKAKKGKPSGIADLLFLSLDKKREDLAKPLQNLRDDLERHLLITEIFEAFDYEVEVDRYPTSRPYDQYYEEPRRGFLGFGPRF